MESKGEPYFWLVEIVYLLGQCPASQDQDTIHGILLNPHLSLRFLFPAYGVRNRTGVR